MVLEDKALDWKALGLLVYLLSKPDDWAVSVAQLVKAKKAGEDAIRGMLKALRDAGYVVMKKQKTGEVDWLVYDTPQTGKNPNRENPDQAQDSKATSGKPQTGKKPNRENPALINTDKELLKTEKDNQTLLGEYPTLNLDAWKEFLQHRKDIKQPVTQAAQTKLLNKLASLSHEQQQATVDKSIENNWRGLFPEKGGNNAARFNTDKQSTYLDELAALPD